jgi:SH3-like domain-containing protein
MIRHCRPSPLRRLRPYAIALSLAAAPLLVPVAAPLAATDITYRVVGVEADDVLNIRVGPSVEYPVIGAIPPTGRGVRLIGACHGWCPVRYHGARGWVHGRFLAREPAVEPFARRETAPAAQSVLAGYWRVTNVPAGDVLQVRNAPSGAAPVIHELSAKDTCVVLGEGCQKPWCQVRIQAGERERVGWVHAKFLAPSDARCGR